MEETWRLLGYGTYDEVFYPLLGLYAQDFSTEGEVREAASNWLREVEKTQPSDESGGQGPTSVQDHIFIVKPDGSRYRFISQDRIGEMEGFYEPFPQ